MSEKIISLAKIAPQTDIVKGLRNLADLIETKSDDVPAVISTCVVILGHTEKKLLDNNEIEHSSIWDRWCWGPRNDIFTIRGLLATVLRD